jgi:hypothetical protein
MKKSLPLLLLLSFAASCTSEAAEKGTEPSNPPAQQPADNETLAANTVYAVKCGCAIDGVGKCGNYIMIDDKYVPLVHSSLGAMEFCKQKDAGAKVEAKGAMQDGTFVAESWKLVQ